MTTLHDVFVQYDPEELVLEEGQDRIVIRNKETMRQVWKWTRGREPASKGMNAISVLCEELGMDVDNLL